MSYHDNSQLIKHLINGDENAYVYLVKNYDKKLFAYALSLTKDHEMARDIIQETFIKTWEFRTKLKPEYSLNGFLHKTVYNQFLNAYNKNRAMSNLEKEYIEALNEIIEETDPDDLQRKISLITKEIENLPNKCKQIFLMSKKEGLTNIEISEYLNISIKAVEAQISKGYTIIRKNIKDKIINLLFLCMRPKRFSKLFKL